MDAASCSPSWLTLACPPPSRMPTPAHRQMVAADSQRAAVNAASYCRAGCPRLGRRQLNAAVWAPAGGRRRQPAGRGEPLPGAGRAGCHRRGRCPLNAAACPPAGGRYRPPAGCGERRRLDELHAQHVAASMATAQTMPGASICRGAIEPHRQLVATPLDASAKAPGQQPADLSTTVRATRPASLAASPLRSDDRGRYST